MAHIAMLIPDMRGGGAERVALTLIEGFVERGHKVDLLLLQNRGELLDLVPTAVRIFDLKADRIRHAIRPLARYLQEVRPDALQASMWPITLVAILARFIARMSSRLAISDHCNVSEQFQGQALRLKLIAWSMRLLYPRADARIAVSKDLATDLAAFSGLAADSFEIVPNPVANGALNSLSTVGADCLWKCKGRRILTVGSLKAEKDHELLLHAFAQLHSRRPAQLIILGEGYLRPKLENLISELGIADVVTMPGFVADPMPYYLSANVFALSSTSEGMPLVLVEALAAGLPVVSTNCRTGPSEILENGKYGRLVPVGDVGALAVSLEEALNEEPNREMLRARARQFRPELAVDRYLDLMLKDV